MSGRSIEGADGPGVFSMFRGSNRYGQLDEGEDMAHSPPTHDFPEPMKFHPRKSKFDTLNEETVENSKGVGDLSTLLPSLEGRFKNVIVSKPLQTSTTSDKTSESGQAAAFPLYNYRRGSTTSLLSRAGADGEGAPFGALKLFERSKQISTTEAGPLPRMVRRASDTNLLHAFAGPLLKRENKQVARPVLTSVEPKDSTPPVEAPKAVKAPVEIAPPKVAKDVTDAPGALSSFGGWLFGGKKKVDVENKDINVFSPTSF